VLCHQEDHVATVDIQEGGLTAYLLKPFSYFKLIFFNEVCYRVLQGVLGIILLGIFVLIFPSMFIFADSVVVLLLSFLLLVGAFALTFVAKMCMGLLAFWMTEARGAFEAMNVLIVIFAGVLLPISLLPDWLEKLSYVLPFAYMLYFPVVAFEGRLTVSQLLLVFCGQMFWLGIAYLIYRQMWKAGLKKYTAVGQ
jgi:ABC-2 type transport system permease protein